MLLCGSFFARAISSFSVPRCLRFQGSIHGFLWICQCMSHFGPFYLSNFYAIRGNRYMRFLPLNLWFLMDMPLHDTFSCPRLLSNFYIIRSMCSFSFEILHHGPQVFTDMPLPSFQFLYHEVLSYPLFGFLIHFQPWNLRLRPRKFQRFCGPIPSFLWICLCQQLLCFHPTTSLVPIP